MFNTFDGSIIKKIVILRPKSSKGLLKIIAMKEKTQLEEFMIKSVSFTAKIELGAVKS